MTVATATTARASFPRLARALIERNRADRALGWAAGAVLMLSIASGIIAGLGAGTDVDPVEIVDRALSFAALSAYVFAIVVGADAFGGEFSRGTLGALLQVVPKKPRLLTAVTLVTTAIAAATGLLAGASASAVALVICVFAGLDVAALDVTAALSGAVGLAVATMGLSLFCLALAVLVRRRAPSVLVGLFAVFLLPLLITLVGDVGRSGVLHIAQLATALDALTSVVEADGALVVGTAVGGGEHVSASQGLLVLACWCAAVVPVAVWAFLRRDLTVAVSRSMRPTQRKTSTVTGATFDLRTSWGRLLRSEFVKAWTLHPVRWLLIGTPVVMVVLGAFRAGNEDFRDRVLEHELHYATTAGTSTVPLLLAVIMTMLIAAEFERGTASITFQAAPRRWQVTGAKASMAAAVAVLLAATGHVLSLTVSTAIYRGRGMPVPRELLVESAGTAAFATLYALLLGLTVAAVAGITRRTVPALVAVFAILVIVPGLLNSMSALVDTAWSPLPVIGNLTYFLPWIVPSVWIDIPFISFDAAGRMQVSGAFNLMIAGVWAAATTGLWFLLDERRAVVTRP